MNAIANGNGSTAKSGVTFIDMSRSDEFRQEYFLDSVHLNTVGAKKFEYSLVSTMTKHIDASKF